MIVDLGFYNNVYNAVATDDFDRLNQTSQTIIEYLTMKTADDLNNSPFLVDVKKAICSQIEYLSENGSLNAIHGNDDGNIVSEKVGSWSRTKGAKNSDIQYFRGLPIAPMVYIYLYKLIPGSVESVF